jgi:monofunctional biosynthetic peptidoglycan transglycosylase
MLRFFVIVIACIFLTIAGFFLTLPNPQAIKGCLVTEMYKVELCPGKPTYVPLTQVSPYFISALLVSEDASFFTHNGFDLEEMRLSFEKNMEKKAFARGGSTITQQLAKNVFLNSEKSIFRKLREAYITYELEKILTKKEILERYVNVVEFGKDLYGVGPASRHYFGKSAAQLNPLEAAYLVHLLPNPKLYSNTFRKHALTKFSRSRVMDITAKIHSVKKISDGQYAWAKANVDQFPWIGIYAPGFEDNGLSYDDPRAFENINSPDDVSDEDEVYPENSFAPPATTPQPKRAAPGDVQDEEPVDQLKPAEETEDEN